MTLRTQYDAIVVGAGPNGLTAANVLVQAGLSTLLVEAHASAGGGTRTAELTEPGFRHDLCSAVHPLGLASPVFGTFDLARHGLSWIDSPSPLAHVIADGSAVTLERSLTETAAQLGPDGRAYTRLLAPFVDRLQPLLQMILGPLRFPRAPLLLARFGLVGIRSMCGLAAARFAGARAAALLAGISAHAMLRLDAPVSASFGLVLASAGHGVGWPVARGGSQAISDALLARYLSLGGELQLNQVVTRLAQLPRARAYLLDVAPKQVLQIAGSHLPERYKRRLARFRYGPGVFKADWALRGAIPWRDPRCARAVTVHLCGDLPQIAAAEASVHAGRLAERPFVLLGQPSVVDPTRAPPGKQTAWAYCHVPHGSAVDALAHIEAQVERCAPGFRDQVLARATHNAQAMEQYNPNNVGGDINGGLSDLSQLFFRPVLRADPYSTPARDIFLCSSSTPPGGGVHGMCGYWAARSALRRAFGRG